MKVYKISHLLTMLMKKSGITDRQLAQYTSLDSRVIYQARIGKTIPALKTLIPLSQYFGVSLNQLIGLPDPKQRSNLSDYAG